MFKSLLDEMKSMNRKVDSFTEPVDLDNEDKYYEVEDEYDEGADAESIVLLDTKVSQPTREEGTKESSSALQDIAQDLD